MTESEQIEEILIEAHAYGVREQVIDSVTEIRKTNPKANRIDSYVKAFDIWVKS